MPHYLLSIMQPDGPPPGAAVLDRVMRDLIVLNQELRDTGSWVFTGGLHAADTATVVRTMGDESLVTDGPYLEGKEHIGGFWVIDAADLDAALDWAEKAAKATALPIEVRPFQFVSID